MASFQYPAAPCSTPRSRSGGGAELFQRYTDYHAGTFVEDPYPVQPPANRRLPVIDFELRNEILPAGQTTGTAR